MDMSICNAGSQLVVEESRNFFCCPICPNFKPAKKARIEKHINAHMKNAIYCKDKIICRCRLSCRAEGHYHCPFCQKTIIRRHDMERHVVICQALSSDVIPVASSPSIYITPSSSAPFTTDFTPKASAVFTTDVIPVASAPLATDVTTMASAPSTTDVTPMGFATSSTYVILMALAPSATDVTPIASAASATDVTLIASTPSIVDVATMASATSTTDVIPVVSLDPAPSTVLTQLPATGSSIILEHSYSLPPLPSRTEEHLKMLKCPHLHQFDQPKMEMKVRGLPLRDIKTFLEFQIYPDTAKNWQKQSLRYIAENYTLERGRLYRCVGGMKRLVLESEEEIVSILSAYHIGQSGAHYDPFQMKDLIFTRYYWPEMTVRIRKWVDGCEECLNVDKGNSIHPSAVDRAPDNSNEDISIDAPKIGDDDDTKPGSSTTSDDKKQTIISGIGCSHLQCPYCYYQCHSKSSYQIHVGSNHPLRCEDTAVGRLGKVVFYQRTANLFHCQICFFTSKSYVRLFDHMLVNHCFSGKTLQTGDSRVVKSVIDKANNENSPGEGEEASLEPLEGNVQEKVLKLKVKPNDAVDEDAKASSVDDIFRRKEHGNMEEVTSGPNKDSNLSGVSLKRKQSSASCSEEEQKEDSEGLDGGRATKEKKDVGIMEYVQQLSSRFYYCKFCKWRSKKKGFLVHHISQKHDVPKPHACKECNKTFMLETLLSSHVNSCHKQGLYQCPFCSFESNFLRGIRRHLNNCKAEERGEGESVGIAEKE